MDIISPRNFVHIFFNRFKPKKCFFRRKKAKKSLKTIKYGHFDFLTFITEKIFIISDLHQNFKCFENFQGGCLFGQDFKLYLFKRKKGEIL